MNTFRISFLAMLSLATLLSISAYPLPAYMKHKTAGEMDGTIRMTSSKSDLVSLGDTVLVLTAPNALILGDKVEVYKPLSENNDASKDIPLEFAGEIVITSLKKSSIFGILVSANSEIPDRSFIRIPLSDTVKNSIFTDFLGKVVTEILPEKGDKKIKTAVVDFTDESGNVTNLSLRLSTQFYDDMCKRNQFSCVPNAELITFLKKYDIQTATSIGRFVRNKMVAELDLDILITAKTVFDGGGQKISLKAWDIRREMSSRPYPVPIPKEYFATRSAPDKTITPFSEIHHGHLTISLNNENFTGERRVDYLFSENVKDLMFDKFKKDFRVDEYGEIEWTDISITINGIQCKSQDGNIYFDDILKSSNYILEITATPSLSGDSSVILGESIKKEAEIVVPPDWAVRTEIVLRISGDNVLIVVDSSPVY